MKNYKGYLIDLDGTMYMGTAEIDGAAQFIDYLNKNDIPHLYVTNNSTKTPEEVTEKLKEMKIDAKPDEVVTSALATANYIAEENSQASVYMPVSYTHLTLPTTCTRCRSRWSPYH